MAAVSVLNLVEKVLRSVNLRNPDEMETQPLFDIPLLDDAAMMQLGFFLSQGTNPFCTGKI